jgi:hypothetical protein
MSDGILFFDSNGLTTSPQLPSKAATQAALPTFSKPKEDFSTPTLSPGTIFYLTIATPHTDFWTYDGPVPTFAALIPLIEDPISHSHSAVLKWKNLMRDSEEKVQEEDWADNGWGNFVLQEKGPRFKERDFTTFVFEHELDNYGILGEYTVLSIIREINDNVLSFLPGPVFTLSSHGPLHHDMGTSLYTVHSGRPKGLVATSKVIASYNTAAEARTAAHCVMDRLLENEAEGRRSEKWEDLGTAKGKHVGKMRGVGRGLLMAMDAKRMWEVKVEYESDVLAGAVARFDKEERNVARGKKPTWRV